MKNDKDINDFINWTKIKIRLHLRSENSELYLKRREIWWASLGVNIGFEIDGKHGNFERPVLIIKAFSRDTLWIIPLTSKEKTGKYYYQINYSDKKNTAILSQLRLISSKRLLRKIGTIAESDFQEIIERIASYLK